MIKVPSAAHLIQREIIITMDVQRKVKIFHNIDSFKLINSDIHKAAKTFSKLLSLNSNLNIMVLMRKQLLMLEVHHFSKKSKYKTIKIQFKKNYLPIVIIIQLSLNLFINRINP
jgi:hypothetical protein